MVTKEDNASPPGPPPIEHMYVIYDRNRNLCWYAAALGQSLIVLLAPHEVVNPTPPQEPFYAIEAWIMANADTLNIPTAMPPYPFLWRIQAQPTSAIWFPHSTQPDPIMARSLPRTFTDGVWQWNTVQPDVVVLHLRPRCRGALEGINDPLATLALLKPTPDS